MNHNEEKWLPNEAIEDIERCRQEIEKVFWKLHDTNTKLTLMNVSTTLWRLANKRSATDKPSKKSLMESLVPQLSEALFCGGEQHMSTRVEQPTNHNSN